jgi:hypothetical protein
VSLPTILLILAAIGIGATVISVIIAFRSDREARSAIFPIVREEETLRAKRARIYIFIWAAITALFLGGWLASLQVLDDAPLIADAPVARPEQTETVTTVTEQPTQAMESSPTSQAIGEQATSQETALADNPAPIATILTLSASAVTPPPPEVPAAQPSTDTPLPPPPATDTAIPATVSPTDTPLPPTATNTPAPTATYTPTPTPLSAAFAVPTTGPRTPAPSGARMGPIQFATQITENVEPINPGDLFDEGADRIYAVFPYRGMVDGVAFKAVWYQNGTELWREESRWEWGSDARFFSFFQDPTEGLYKLELQVNDSVLATGLFEVR